MKNISKETKINRILNFINKANKKHQDKYKNGYERVFEQYKNNYTSIEIFCPVCKEYFKQRPDNHIAGKGCRKCANKLISKSRRLNWLDFIQRSNKIHKFKYCYGFGFEYFKDSSSKIPIWCPVCKKIFWQTPNSHLGGYGCKLCGLIQSATLRRLDWLTFIDRSNKIHKFKYCYGFGFEYFNGVKNKIPIWCPVCKKIFYQAPDAHMNGTGCPNCINGQQISAQENYIYQYIKTITSCRVETSDRTLLKPKEIDIYIPELKIAIEYNGLHWHSDNKIKNINYHLDKTNLCKEKGIQLYHIFEDEWLNHSKLMKAKLKRLFNFEQLSLDSSKFKIKNISKELANKFLNKYHLLGLCNATNNYGLFYKNRLIAVLCIKNEEILRYAQLNHFNFDGFTYLVDNIKGNLIIKNDKRWPIKYSGFKVIGELEPKCYYTYSNKRYNKIPTNLVNKKYKKIYDCGYIILKRG